MQTNKTAYLFTFLTILFWAGAASAFKIALQHITPVQLLCLSSLLSLLVLSVLLATSRKLKQLKQLSTSQWLYLVLLGAVNPFLYYMILFQAYDLLPGQVAMSLNYLWPVMLALLSVPILKHELKLTGLVSICLSFCGAVIIASAGNFAAWGQLNPTGLGLVLASTLVWASYWLLSARLPVDASIKLFVGFISGTALAWSYALFSGQLSIQLADIPYLAIGYVGVLEMGITFFIWLKALQMAPNATRIANLIYITPFISLLFLALILDEKILPSTLLGLVIIICGILLQQYWKPAKST
ncbi:MAG: DMT family transporter [Gammaproteobacteria bacterium]|nr:DMT family transporter [Gammaproteobacteria bacterium]